MGVAGEVAMQRVRYEHVHQIKFTAVGARTIADLIRNFEESLQLFREVGTVRLTNATAIPLEKGAGGDRTFAVDKQAEDCILAGLESASGFLRRTLSARVELRAFALRQRRRRLRADLPRHRPVL